MINIFIGYDSNEVAAYHTLCHSIITNSTHPVAITPVKLSHVANDYVRARNTLSSTEFSISRFLVPHMMNYQGWALFMDCDMLVLDDISRLWRQRDDRYAIQCVKHDYVPKTEKKFLDQVQTKYEKKNWSSVMLMNCAQCNRLTPDYVMRASGLELHQFKWLADESLIGNINVSWNWLVGEYENHPLNGAVRNYHYTLGGPWFAEYRNLEENRGTEHQNEWFWYYEDMKRIEDG